MDRTLKQEATIPPASSLRAQQQKFDHFRREFNELRPHQALDMKRPGQHYHPSTRSMPKRIEPYDYPQGTTWSAGSAAAAPSACFASRSL